MYLHNMYMYMCVHIYIHISIHVYVYTVFYAERVQEDAEVWRWRAVYMSGLILLWKEEDMLTPKKSYF